MLMAASEQISSGLDSHDQSHMRLHNAHTLVRVLCHKKDREASKFLKGQYQFPMSSGDFFPLRRFDCMKYHFELLWVIYNDPHAHDKVGFGQNKKGKMLEQVDYGLIA